MKTHNPIKRFFIILLLLLIIDSFWVYFIAGPKYKKFIPEIQGSPLVANIKMAILVYIVMGLLITFCLYKDFTSYDMFIIGFSSYFIYDFTNAAIFKKWDKIFGLFDAIWGGILFATVSYITIKYDF